MIRQIDGQLRGLSFHADVAVSMAAPEQSSAPPAGAGSSHSRSCTRSRVTVPPLTPVIMRTAPLPQPLLSQATGPIQGLPAAFFCTKRYAPYPSPLPPESHRSVIEVSMLALLPLRNVMVPVAVAQPSATVPPPV